MTTSGNVLDSLGRSEDPRVPHQTKRVTSDHRVGESGVLYTQWTSRPADSFFSIFVSSIFYLPSSIIRVSVTLAIQFHSFCSVLVDGRNIYRDVMQNVSSKRNVLGRYVLQPNFQVYLHNTTR
jgi:hypothetical protein